LTWKDKDSTKGIAAQQDIAATSAPVAPATVDTTPAPAPYEEVNIDDIPF
jgi:hypothetical protein